MLKYYFNLYQKKKKLYNNIIILRVLIHHTRPCRTKGSRKMYSYLEWTICTYK